MGSKLKKCRACGVVKPLSDFYRCASRRSAADGLQTACKACQKGEHAAWFKANRARAREYARRSGLKHRPRKLAYARTYYQANHEEALAKARARLLRLKREAYDVYGHVCACCGESEPLFLSIDHMNNDGYAHRKLLGRKTLIYLWLKRHGYPRTFQVLCMNCNYGKRMNGGVCPHVTANVRAAS